MFREEWRRSRQGKKVPEGRCGRTIEAKPLSGQTCLIEPAEGSAGNNGGRNMAMAALVCKLHCAGTISLVPTLPNRCANRARPQQCRRKTVAHVPSSPAIDAFATGQS